MPPSNALPRNYGIISYGQSKQKSRGLLETFGKCLPSSCPPFSPEDRRLGIKGSSCHREKTELERSPWRASWSCYPEARLPISLCIWHGRGDSSATLYLRFLFLAAKCNVNSDTRIAYGWSPFTLSMMALPLSVSSLSCASSPAQQCIPFSSVGTA